MYPVLCKVHMALRYQKVKKHTGSSSVIQISLRDHPPNHKRVGENAFIFKSKQSPTNLIFEGCLHVLSCY